MNVASLACLSIIYVVKKWLTIMSIHRVGHHLGWGCQWRWGRRRQAVHLLKWSWRHLFHHQLKGNNSIPHRQPQAVTTEPWFISLSTQRSHNRTQMHLIANPKKSQLNPNSSHCQPKEVTTEPRCISSSTKRSHNWTQLHLTANPTKSQQNPDTSIKTHKCNVHNQQTLWAEIQTVWQNVSERATSWHSIEQ